MMGTRAHLNGEEWDAFSRWKRCLIWKPGQRQDIKRRFWKRVRTEQRTVKVEIYADG